ncbi:MAG TPA: cyclopropane-fatty-acyl-phospholipid synthase family protein [Candidatus Binatia bacterium]|nr:cyclopropane-fatty-acyl-phospholipid synthase family protein [Candidatus Binatia bacterium]
MSAERFASSDPHARIAIAVLRAIFGDTYAREFSIELWEGTRVPAANAERFVLRVNAPGALRAAFALPVDLSTARAFGAGLLDIEGDLEAAVDAFYRAGAPRGRRLFKLLKLLSRLPKIAPAGMREARLHGRVHSRARDRAAIGFHYDQPIEFYRSFLDRDMVYSCAYWEGDAESLDDAQSAKLDYTLRKLRLRPGERLLDIGCGWGALVVRAAERFGARALGITLSAPQCDEARRRIAAAGLADRARVELRDYRELAGERFDKIVSVGMFEHVGRARFAGYFRAAYESLNEGGLFLNHAIADRSGRRGGGRVTTFVKHFIFPDGELVPISDTLAFAERVGFEVRDVESLREHYVRTLRAWVANLERNRDAAIAAAGEQSYRLWRLYMAGSAQGFRVGRIGVYQSLLARPHAGGRVDLPPTRADLYDAQRENGRLGSAVSVKGSTRTASP